MPRIQRTVVSTAVYDTVKEMLFDGVWGPGDRIDRKALAVRLGVSPTPVNDALHRLTGEGLVESRFRDGFFVPDYSDLELADLFAVRAGIESVAARLCAEEAQGEELERLCALFDPFAGGIPEDGTGDYLRADKAFHAGLLAASGSARLGEVERFFGHVFRSYEHGLVRDPEETLPEHRRIIDALRSRNGSAAQAAMADHLLRSRQALAARGGAAGAGRAPGSLSP